MNVKHVIVSTNVLVKQDIKQKHNANKTKGSLRRDYKEMEGVVKNAGRGREVISSMITAVGF